MSDTPRRTTVTTHGTAKLRLRPALMLMLARLREAEATLDLGLTALKRRAADTGRRLTRLGATRVEVGDPHEDDCANPDPMARFRAAAVPKLPRAGDAPLPKPRGVNLTLTAAWDIAAMTGEEVLALVDQLRFDAAADVEPPEPAAELAPWAGPEEQMRAMMAQAHDPPADLSPKFLYVTRPTADQLAAATAEAFAAARAAADRLAVAAGRRLGPLDSVAHGVGHDPRAPHLLMEWQRIAALVAASGYDPGEAEVVSEDPRAAWVTVAVHATHHLE